MITSLAELVADRQQHAFASPQSSTRGLLKTPGLPREEIVQIRNQFPDLPEDYLQLIANYDLRNFGMCFHEFGSLHPKCKTFIDRLKWDNAACSRDKFVELNVTSVGSGPECWICLAGPRSPYPYGSALTVFLPGWESAPLVLARNFETFLIVLGNLSQINYPVPSVGGLRPQVNQDQANAEFRRRLLLLDLTDEQRANWL